MTSYQKLKKEVEFYKNAYEESNRRIRALLFEPESELAVITKFHATVERDTELEIFKGTANCGNFEVEYNGIWDKIAKS